MIRALALVALVAVAAASSEVLDPPTIDGWRYSHRAYHALAGAIIGFCADRGMRVVAPGWCARHPVLRRVFGNAVVIAAGTTKEAIDRHRGGESLHHSLTDIGVTSLGGVVGVELSIRF